MTAPLAKDNGWTSALRVACALRCADYGDQACLDVMGDCQPCEECLTEAYGPPRETEAYRCPLTPDMFKPRVV